MENLENILSSLPPRHQIALKWFADRAGEEHSWPDPLNFEGGVTHLVSKAKGIYKPHWSEYALSVRQVIGGPYPDLDPLERNDGTWIYKYYQENRDPQARDQEFTNKGLISCWHDHVPIGVMRQISREPKVKYKILGLALVVGWENGYFILEGFSDTGFSHGLTLKDELEATLQNQELVKNENGSFDPCNQEDARVRILASIVLRRGQPKFRASLIDLYKGKCAISACQLSEVLEAAHIVPFKGPETNHVANGILLRADLHTLLDLGLIAIDPKDQRVKISQRLMGTDYEHINGQEVWLPQDQYADLRRKSLEQHLLWSGIV